MSPAPGTSAFGQTAAAATALLMAAYAVALGIGLATLPSPDVPIRDPWFTAMEVLILLLVPALVALMAAVHLRAAPRHRAFTLTALLFMTLSAGTTAVVHFSVLTLASQPDFAGLDLVFAFSWPSVAYALDILAWDVFFALAVLFAAPSFEGGGALRASRWLFFASGLLALAGLAGVGTGDMTLRNIGILGYEVVFLVAAVVLIRVFRRNGA